MSEEQFITDVLSSPPEDPSQQQQQSQQQKSQPKKRTPRYQWDVDRTRLCMAELLKYVSEHGFPKTSHLTGSHGAHPYDSIATTINNQGIPANNRACDGRVVESRWDTLKKLCYEKCSDVSSRFIKHLPDVAHEHSVEEEELVEATSTVNVEGQLANIKINKTSPHYKLLTDAWDTRMAKETVQSIPLNEISKWVSSVMDAGYKVKPKRKSASSPPSSTRKKQRAEHREQLVDELGVAVSDSDESRSVSRNGSRSASPRVRTSKQSPTSLLNEKLAAYLDIQLKQQQQQESQRQQQHQPEQVIDQAPGKKLDFTYESLEEFYEKEQVKPEARSKLHDMGVNVLDDLHYVTCDDYLKAGLSVILSRKLAAKVSRHKPD